MLHKVLHSDDAVKLALKERLAASLACKALAAATLQLATSLLQEIDGMKASECHAS
jgi:hypothetical protein